MIFEILMCADCRVLVVGVPDECPACGSARPFDDIDLEVDA